VPTLEEFLEVSRAAFRFMLDEYGFAEVPCLREPLRYCLCFERDARVLEIRGEGYGTSAACHVSAGSQGPLATIYLVPDTSRPRRSRRQLARMGQLDDVRELASLTRAHLGDFLSGDLQRFERAWEKYRPR